MDTRRRAAERSGTIERMHDQLDHLAQLAAVRAPFTTSDAAAVGVDRHVLARLVRHGVLVRIARSAYVPAAQWRSATPQARHLLQCSAVLGRRSAVALSHTSAVVAHGLAVHRVDLGLVHVARRTDGRAGRVGGRPPVQLHPRLSGRAHVLVGGVSVCRADVAVLQVADWHGVAAGLVAAESGLHRGLFSIEQLRSATALIRPGRGRAHVDRVAKLADRHSESPGETLTRLLLLALGIEQVEQQARLVLPRGGVARVDFLLADRNLVIEFDGAVKYEGADGRQQLIREKIREDRIRETGLRVVRLTWPDLDRPARVHALLDAGR